MAIDDGINYGKKNLVARQIAYSIRRISCCCFEKISHLCTYVPREGRARRRKKQLVKHADIKESDTAKLA